MTPPRTPGHESDEIVDMTPVFSPDEDEQEIDEQEIDEQEISDMTPEYLPEGGPEEFEDGAPADTPEEYPPEIAGRTPAYAPRGKQARSLARAPRYVPESEPVEPPSKRPKAGGNRWKRILVVAAGLVVVALVGRTLGQAIGIGNLAGGNKASQATAPAAPSTPTPKPVQIGNGTSPSTPGPLILLNPGVVRQGTSVGVAGSGFDPGAVIDLTIMRKGSATALSSTFVQADKGGTFSNATLGVPMALSSGNFTVTAKERNGRITAQAIGDVAGGAPQVKLGTQVGKPGDVIVLGLHGFAPGETVNVYWNTMSGQPVTTFKADGGGSIGQGKIAVPFGAVGDNTFLFVGATSQSLVAASFLVLQLYPTVKLGSYALKADNLMSFSGTGFGPGERVFVFLNSTMGQPLAVVNTDAAGSFKNAPGFVVPFTIKGKQTLIFMGEQSRAPDAVSFTVLPYAPVVEASTYGGFPGTTITFYATGFAHNEVVHIYTGHTKGNQGNMVSCFQTDSKGNAASVGSYQIPGDAQGALSFSLVGEKSGGVGVASLNVAAPPTPVHTPPQPPFTCPLDPAPSSPQTGPTPAPTTPQGKLTQPSQQTALQAVAHISATTSHDGALLSIGAVAKPPVTRMIAHRAREGWPRLSFEQARRAWRSFLGQVRIPPLLVGLGLLWLVLVLVLNITLIVRSSRQEVSDRENSGDEDAAPARASAALVTGPGEGSVRSKYGSMLSSKTLLGCASSVVEAQPQVSPQVSPADTQYQLGGTVLPGAQSAGHPRTTGPTVRAAQCTATWHGGGSQPGHDATFVQTNVKLAGEESTFSVFLVADGRSRRCTDVTASQVAVEHIARRVITAMSSGPGIPPNLIRPLFKYAVMQTGDTLLARNATYSTDASTTLTGALVVGEHAYVVNVGNSRTYLFSPEGGLWQVTKDHSVVSGMVAAGLVGATAMDESPHAQQLYRSLGNTDHPIRVDTFAMAVLPGDQLLLCSDGLWRKVRDAQIEAILLCHTADPRGATWELIHAASEQGAEDDISAIVVHLLGAA